MLTTSQPITYGHTYELSNSKLPSEVVQKEEKTEQQPRLDDNSLVNTYESVYKEGESVSDQMYTDFVDETQLSEQQDFLKTQEEYNEEILQNRRKSQSLLGNNLDITV